MAEYIEREALLKRLKFKVETDTTYYHLKQRGLESAMAQVRKAPAADVVEVVRCRDCEHHKGTSVKEYEHCCLTGLTVGMDDFCSYGERRESDG